MRTLITAHAGAEGSRPNSESSLSQLKSLGADILEVDVRLYRGSPVLAHDKADAQALPLKEALALLMDAPSLNVNLDVKEPGIAMKAYEAAVSAGFAGRFLFTGDVSREEAFSLRRLSAPLWFNEYLLDEEERADPFAAIARLGSPVLNISKGRLTDSLLAHRAAALSVWTVDEEETLARLLKAGVRNITTRAPILALRLRADIQGG